MDLSVWDLSPRDLAFAPLFSIVDPPQRIWVQGTTDSLNLLRRLPERALTLVGTRLPSRRTLHLLEALVGDLEGSDLILLSGLARGVDTQVHELALRHGLPTVAVMATPLSQTYPTENEGLRLRILRSGGLIITERAEGETVYPSSFIRRNRLLGAWAQAVGVIEAGARSGALSTARSALRNDRHCFAVPGFPGDESLSGNEALLNGPHLVHPLWNAGSLGLVWGELSTLHQKITRRSPLPRDRDLTLLVREVKRLSRLQRFARVEEALNWAQSVQGWAPQRFLTVLQRALDTGQVLDNQGLLSAP